MAPRKGPGAPCVLSFAFMDQNPTFFTDDDTDAYTGVYELCPLLPFLSNRMVEEEFSCPDSGQTRRLFRTVPARAIYLRNTQLPDDRPDPQ